MEQENRDRSLAWGVVGFFTHRSRAPIQVRSSKDVREDAFIALSWIEDAYGFLLGCIAPNRRFFPRLEASRSLPLSCV